MGNTKENIVIIMAGGLGKRMKSTLPKVLHDVLNKPMLVHVVERALELKPTKILVVVGKYLPVIFETLSKYGLNEYVEFINQPTALGTGHAIQCCREKLNTDANVLILSGDVPLIKTDTLKEMMNNLNHARIMTTILEDPHGYGRIIEHNGVFEKIVEEKDCNDEERKCQKTNAGIYAFNSNMLYKYLPYLSNDNAQKEYYLTDIVEIIKVNEDVNIDLYDMPIDRQIELTGVNTKEQLEELNIQLQNSFHKTSSSPKKRIVVTGGSGFIGSHTCVELLKTYEIIIIDNLCNSNENVIDKIKQIANEDITFYKEDLLNKNRLNDIFDKHKPDTVIHFAGLKAVGESIQKPIYYYQNNIISTLNLLEIMKSHQCYNLIFSSSATVYGSQNSPLKENMVIGDGVTNPYGQTKFMIEVMLKDLCKSDSKWNIISLRYFNPVGAHESGLIGENPNDIPNNLMPFMLKVSINNNTDHNLGPRFNKLNVFGNDYSTNDGTCKRDFIHVVDLAKGHLAALKKINELNGYNVFNLGTGNPISVLEMIETFKRINKVELPYECVSRRDGDLEVCFCDPTYTESVLQWKTEKTLDDMCKDAWKFQLSNPNGF